MKSMVIYKQPLTGRITPRKFILLHSISGEWTLKSSRTGILHFILTVFHGNGQHTCECYFIQMEICLLAALNENTFAWLAEVNLQVYHETCLQTYEFRNPLENLRRLFPTPRDIKKFIANDLRAILSPPGVKDLHIRYPSCFNVNIVCETAMFSDLCKTTRNSLTSLSFRFQT